MTVSDFFKSTHPWSIPEDKEEPKPMTETCPKCGGSDIATLPHGTQFCRDCDPAEGIFDPKDRQLARLLGLLESCEEVLKKCSYFAGGDEGAHSLCDEIKPLLKEIAQTTGKEEGYYATIA